MNKKEINNLLTNPEAFEAAAKKGYEAVDTNKSGYIDYNEISIVLQNFSKGNNMPSPTKADVDKIFKQLDIDTNGKIDFKEFKEFFRTFLKQMS